MRASRPVNGRLQSSVTYVTDVTQMPINLSDPRVRKTRIHLQSALVRLILAKGYDAVTVQDIATEADTARITFYRHYADKEALLSDCLDALYADLQQTAAHVSPEALERGQSPVTILYQHMEAHEDLYRILFLSRGTSTVIQRLRHFMSDHAEAGMRAALGERKATVPLELIAAHAASAQLGLAMWWLEQGKPYPAGYMGQVSAWMSLAGVSSALGIQLSSWPPPPGPSGSTSSAE
jgi:AcrR family transcriptional regulator